MFAELLEPAFRQTKLGHELFLRCRHRKAKLTTNSLHFCDISWPRRSANPMNTSACNIVCSANRQGLLRRYGAAVLARRMSVR
jgi:hypothetical protein